MSICSFMSLSVLTVGDPRRKRFRKGFALCSIISHYYMSHLLQRFPRGEAPHPQDTHTHTHTNDGWHVTHNSHRPLKSQQHTLAPDQERSRRRQPSTAAATEEEKTTQMTPEQRTAEHKVWGNTSHPWSH